jgi:hypothetical protein
MGSFFIVVIVFIIRFFKYVYLIVLTILKKFHTLNRCLKLHHIKSVFNRNGDLKNKSKQIAVHFNGILLMLKSGVQ